MARTTLTIFTRASAMALHAGLESGPSRRPDRPRLHIVVGLLIAVALLAALVWFAVTHTDMGDAARNLFSAHPAFWSKPMARV